jgi:glycosyltransferase involved in cell wall biosynthesis
MSVTLLETVSDAPTLQAPARLPRVCFSLPYARKLLDGGSGYFGGAEVRGSTFLRGLAKRGAFDLHVVVIGGEQAPVVSPDGFTIHFRPDLLWDPGNQDDVTRSVWAEVDADLYVAFGANQATAELARFCQPHGSALLLSIASDAAFDPFVYEGSRELDPYGAPGHFIWYAMHHASEVVVQTERQQAQFLALEARHATLIRNPAPSSARSAARTAPAYNGRILWIGRTDPNKRFADALALAAALPKRPMIMVCNEIRALGPGALAELEAKLPNLMLADQVALEDVDALFRFSDVLVNTSVVEGFPNTFLQAGMHGIPIVSMSFDPDGMLSTHGCGRVADGTRAGLARAVEALLSNPKAYAKAAAANTRWLHERHDPADRVNELVAMVHRTLAAHPRRPIAHRSARP